MKTLLPLLKNYPVLSNLTIKKWFSYSLFLLFAITGSQPVSGQSSQIYSANGTFTVPAGVTSVTVECWGGGGKGGAVSSTTGARGGGGGGGYSRSVIAVIPGSNYTVNVGLGSTTTAAGGDSWFNTAATVLARGGGSASNTATTAGTGAAAGIGDVAFGGGAGRTGVSGSYGGGGGSSAGTAAAGVAATNQNGASAPAGGGNGGNGRASTTGVGLAGVIPGGGGGGAYRTSFGSSAGGNGANGRVTVSWVPAYAAQFISMNTGSSLWCPGETRTISVTVKNIGQATWTNVGPDINIGVKWNGDPDYLVRTDANDLAPGATQTYFLTVTAPVTAGSNNLTFDAVFEGTCWFGNNGGTCGPGNTVFTSPLITIGVPPSIMAHPPTTNRTYCVGAGTHLLTVTATGSGISYQWYSNTVASNVGGSAIAGATSSAYLPSSSTPGTLYYYAVVSGCSPAATSNVSGSYTVNQHATLTLTSASSSQNQSLCIGNAIETISLNAGGAASGVVVSAGSIPAGLITDFTAGVFTISGTPTTPGNYSFSLQTTGSLCNNPVVNFNILVQDNPTLLLNAAAGTEIQTVCINTPVTDITYLVAGGATGVNVTGLPAGINTSLVAGLLTLSGSPTQEGIFNFEVVTTGPVCTNITLAGTITVTGDGTIMLSSDPATANQLVCEGSAINDIVYSIGGSATGAEISSGSLPAGVTGVFSSGTFIISGTPIASGVYNYTVSTTGSSCVNPAMSGTITVNTPAILLQTSAAGTESQVLCINTAASDLTFSVGGGATGALITAGTLPTGMTGVYDAGVFTVSGTPTVAGIFNFTISTTGACTNGSLSGSVTVNEDAFINLTSATASPVNCINTPLTTISFATSGSATGAAITSGTLPAGITATYSGSVFTISGTAVESGVFPYTITTTGPCGNASASGTITVNADGTIALTSPGAEIQTLCINNAITPITYSIGGGATGASISSGTLPAGVTGSYSGGVFTINGTPTASGTFNFTVRANGPCVQPTLNGTITVQANSVISLTSGIGTNNRTVCINNAMPAITYSITGGGTGASLTAGSFPAGITGTYSGGIFTISGTPSVSGSFPYTITTSGPCVNTSASGTITVNADGTIALTSPGSEIQTLCINTAIAPITYSIGGGATGASISSGALPAGVTGTYSGGIFTISGTPTASGTFNFTVRANGPCIQPTLSGTIVVDANSTINLTSGAGTNNRTVCINAAMPSIIWTVGGGATGATVTGLPAGISAAYNSINKTYTLSGASTVSGSFPYVVTTTGPCVNVTGTGTITVNADATIALTSGAGSNIQAVCVSQQAISPITYLVGGGGTGATVSGLPAGITGSYNAGTKVYTISGTPTAAGTFNFTVTTTGPCVKPALGGTITVHARPVANAITGINTVCVNETIALASNATGAAPLTYTWASSNTAVATVTSAGVVTGIAAGSANITYTVTNGNGCTQTSAAFGVTVRPIATGTLTATETSGSASNDNVICAGANVTFTATPGFVVYHFKVNGVSVQNGTANVYNTTSLTNGAVVTVDVTNASSCTVVFNSATITVNPVPSGSLTAAETSGVANDNQICAGESVTFTATSGYPNYVFMVNGTGVQSGASNVFTTTSLTGTATVTVEVTSTNGCKSIWGPQVITVSGLPGGSLVAAENSGSAPDDNSICAGGEVTFTATAGFSNYNFIVNGSSVQSGASNIYNSTTLTNPSIITVQVTNAGGCQANLGPVIISVNDLPSGNLIGTENSGVANDMVICAGEQATFTAVSGYSNYTFLVNGSSVQSGASASFTSSTMADGDVVTVEVTGDGGCIATFNSVAITVDPLPSAGFSATENSGTPDNNTICAGANMTFTADAGYANYQFLVNGSAAQNGSSRSFSTVSLQDGDEVSVIITASTGCSITAPAIVVTVIDIPAGTLAITETSGIAPNDATICAGEAATFTATPGYANYTFYVNGVIMQSSASNVFTSSSLSNGASVDVEASNASGCSQVFNSFIITVNPLPVGNISASENSGTINDNVICPNSEVTFTATAGFVNYDFRIDGVSMQSSASSTFVTSSIGVNSVVTVRVTNANGCSSLSNSVAVTVNPVPVGSLTAVENSGNASNDNAICTGETIVFTATAGYSSYIFQVNGSGVQSGSSNEFTSSTIADGDVVTVIVEHANGCSAIFTPLSISVYDYPVVPAITGITGVCIGATTTLSNTVTGGVWSVDNSAIATVDAVTGEVSGVAAGIATVYYSVTNGNGCTTVVSAQAEVFELPVPTLMGPNPFCPGTEAEYITEAGQFNYAWTVTGGTIVSGGTSTDHTISVDWNLPGVKSIFVNYTNANGCAGATSTTVTGSTGTVPVVSGPFQVCNNSAGRVYTTQAGYTNYTWTVTGGTITSGGSSSDNSVTVTWTTAGTGIVSVNFTDLNGCTAATPTNYNVTVFPLPVATVGGNTQVCQNGTSPMVTFTGSGGTTPYTFQYQVNGGSIQSVTTVSGNSVAVPVPTGVTGSFEYSLVNISGANGCEQTQTGSATVVVNTLPSAMVSGDATYCQNDVAAITFTGSNGTAPYTFTYTMNGGAPQTISTISGNSVELPVNTSVAGTFVFALTGVSDANGCTQVASGNAAITINALPTATISGNAGVCINAPSPLVTFTGGAGTSPYTFSYNINGGATQTIVSAGSTATVAIATNVAGNFTVNLESVTDASSTLCSQAQSGSVTINVSPASVGGTLSGSATVCTSVNSTVLTLGGYTGTITGWEYSINGGSTWVPIAHVLPTYTASSLTQTTQYRVLVQSGNCSPAVSSTATITVLNISNGGSVSGSATVCAGSNGGTLTLSGNTGSVIRWESSVNGGTSWTNISNTTTSQAYTNLNQTTHYRAIVANGPCVESASAAAIITVNARPTAILSGTGNMCSGGGRTLTLTVTGSGTISGTLSGGIPFSGTAPTISVVVTPAGSTVYTIASLSDANCSALPANISGSATVTVLPLPAVFTVTPANAVMCEGTVTPLTATGSIPTTGTATASSGNVNLAIPDANILGGSGVRTHNLNVAGIPAGAVITGISVNFTVPHSATGDLEINLRAPNGNVLNLVDSRGGTGNNFTSTTISTAGVTPVNAGTNPYSNTYTADAINNLGPAGYVSNVGSFNGLMSVPNGAWTIVLEDNVYFRGFLQTNTGTLTQWNITINYTVPSNLPSTWSPLTGLYSDPGATIPYAGQALTTVYASPLAGSHSYTATFTNIQGCAGTATSNITVNPAPVVTILADYCAIPGQIQLTANSVPAGTGYLWNTGATTQTIGVDEAGTYEVTVTTGLGCPGRATSFIAQELVTNGDFEAGNTGFFTEYTLASGFDLYPEGEYAVGTDAHLYHDNFYGKDHTTAAQTGNFMMINGSSTLIGAPGRLRTIWQQTVEVLPNTDYYFSAWGMNLNPGSPARLQFEVNGVPVGTIADLNSAPKPTSQGQVNINNWVRFYSNPTWNSGVTTTAVIRIINLNTDPGGNDFGLDDISFGTLRPFITLVSPPGTDAQTLCVNTPITSVIYSVAGGAAGPNVTGLPAGVISTYNGTTVTISGTPTAAGTFGYSITTTGTCNPITVTGTLTVQQQSISLSSGSGAQNACMGSPIATVQYTLGGTATGATVSGLPAGVTSSVSGGVVTISGTPTVSGIFNYTINTTGTCQPASTTGSINVQGQSITLFSGNTAQTRCVNTAILNIVYTTGGTATGATVSGLPPGVTGNYSGGIYIISGTPTLAGTYNYTVTTSGTCNPASVGGSIQVNPAATIVLSSSAGTNAQTVCVSTGIVPIAYSIGGGGTGAMASGLPAGVTGTYSGGVFTISGMPSANGTFNYTVTTTGTCAQATATGSITVEGATVSLSSGTANQTVCNNTAVSNIIFAIGGTASGAVASNLPPGLTGNYASGLFTISGTPTTAGTYNYTVTSTGSCAGASAGGTITVGVGSIGGTLPEAYVCNNSGGVITLTGHSGNILRWETSIDGGTTWSNISNVTATHTFSNISTLTQFRVLIQSGSCPTAYSSVGIVGVANMWTGAIDSDWFNSGNWAGNNLPSMSCEDVIIPVVSGTNVYPVLTAGTASVYNIIVHSGATLTVDNATLEIAGSINNSGNFNAQNGTINFNGTDPQLIPANAFAADNLQHLLIGNSHPDGVEMQGALNIYGSLKFTDLGTKLETGNMLTIKSTATGTAWVGDVTGKTIEGNVTVERYINTGTGAGMHPKSWQLLAVPTIGSQTINQSWQEGSTFPNQNNVPGYGTMMTSNYPAAVSLGFDAYTAPGGTVKTYNATASAWIGIPNTNSLQIANPNGYMILVRGDRSVFTSSAAPVPTVLRTTGKLYTTGADAPPTVNVFSGKFQSVGNPYASAIDLTSPGITRVNLADVYYVWDPALTNMGSNSTYGLGAYQTLTLGMDGNYHVTPGGGSYGAGGSIRNTIESGQAFMVLSDGNEGSIGFSEAAKVEGSNLVSRAAVVPESEIRTNLYVMNNGHQVLIDGVANQFNEVYSSEVNVKDAPKLGNLSETFAISRGGKMLAVEQRKPASASDTIFFNLGQIRQQQYKLEFKPANMAAPGLSAWLEDSYLNTSIPVSLDEPTTIAFSVTANAPGSNAPNRFRLVFRQIMAPLPVTFVTVSATRNAADASVNVKWEVDNETSIENYEVERSENGRTFTGILTEGPRANNGGQASYQRNDISALKQANFYRIKAISRNGLVQYSPIVKVDEILMPGTITVYPNPVINKTLNLKCSGLNAGKYSVNVFTAHGKPVYNSSMEMTGVNTTRSFQLGNLAAGTYYLVLSNRAGKKWQATFIVQ